MPVSKISVTKMEYENFFTQRLNELRCEGRYRVSLISNDAAGVSRELTITASGKR
jgi:hypothetical protein